MNEKDLPTANKLLVMITTTGSMDEAKKLSRKLVEKKLVACVQLSEIKSIYTWQDTVEEDQEIRLMIKLLPKHRDEVISYLKDNHPYETPEIISTIFDSETDYYNWCLDVSA